jgi:hypothetical protein
MRFSQNHHCKFERCVTRESRRSAEPQTPLTPAKAGVQCGASKQRAIDVAHRRWIPAFAGMSGGALALFNASLFLTAAECGCVPGPRAGDAAQLGSGRSKPRRPAVPTARHCGLAERKGTVGLIGSPALATAPPAVDRRRLNEGCLKGRSAEGGEEETQNARARDARCSADWRLVDHASMRRRIGVPWVRMDPGVRALGFSEGKRKGRFAYEARRRGLKTAACPRPSKQHGLHNRKLLLSDRTTATTPPSPVQG